MIPPARRVRHLRLSCASEADLWRGVTMVEDALRTATLPETDGGRLIVVRRLDLGRIYLGASPQTLALSLEARAAELMAHAAPGGSPEAERAEAAWFPDRVEAARLLLDRVLSQGPATAWYWSLAIPGYRPRMPTAEVIALALHAAASGVPGPLGQVALLEGLRATGRLEAALAPVSELQGPALLAGLVGADPLVEVAFSRAEVGSPPPTPPEALGSTPRAWLRVLARQLQRWGPLDARLRWLAVAAVLAEAPALLGTTRLLDEAAGRIALARTLSAAWAASGSPRTSALPRSPPLPPRGPSRETPPPSDTPAKAQSEHRSPTEDSFNVPSEALTEAPAPQGPSLSPAPLASAQGSATEAPSDAEPAAPDAPLPEGVHPTEAGGLLFAIPVLERLGLPERLEEEPELALLDLPRRVLAGALSALSLPPEDASWALVSLPEPTPAGRQPEVEAWTTRLFAAMEEVPGGWPRVARRPALLAQTRTHIDVWFALSQAELDLRRLGLDLDPGWVPWLGRVVSFHYAEQEELNALR